MKRLRLNEPYSKGTKGNSGGNGSGRDPATGRFLPGHNMPGPGNPGQKRMAEIRGIMLEVVTPADMTEMIRKIVSMAKRGDLTATKLLLDRLFGKPPQSMTLEMDPSMEGWDRDERFL